MNKPVLELASIKKSFSKGSSNKIEVLKGVDLQLFPGEIVALVAPSGAGKSTLLQIAGLLDKPLSGKIFIDGQEIQNRSDNQLTMIRRREIGFVYQFHHLLPEFSSRENIDLPKLANGFPSKDAQRRSNELLDLVNLSNAELLRKIMGPQRMGLEVLIKKIHRKLGLSFFFFLFSERSLFQ